jgi:hypothetical protein
MIKDILVNLATGSKRDVAADFAISVAAALDAHLVGVAFAHEPIVPGTIFDGVSASVVAAYRTESKNSAKAAAERFEKSARGAALSVESRVIGASIEGAAEIFGRLGRRYDLSIVRQTGCSIPDGRS